MANAIIQHTKDVLIMTNKLIQERQLVLLLNIPSSPHTLDIKVWLDGRQGNDIYRPGSILSLLSARTILQNYILAHPKCPRLGDLIQKIVSSSITEEESQECTQILVSIGEEVITQSILASVIEQIDISLLSGIVAIKVAKE